MAAIVAQPVWACALGLIVFFLPPFAIGDRMVFLSDIFILLWGAVSFLDLCRVKKTRVMACLGIVLFFLSYLSGAFRGPLVAPLADIYYSLGRETAEFLGVREFVVTMRFASWWMVILWSCYRRPATREPRSWLATLRFVALCFSAAVILDRQGSFLHSWFGKIYGFDANYEYWLGRARGTMQSPVEAGTVLGLMMATIVASTRKWKLSESFVLGVVFVALVLTHTASAFVGCGAAIVFPHFFRRSKKTRLWIGVALICTLLAVVFLERQVLLQKINDISGRVGPWKILVTYCVSSWRSILFGQGMVPIASDQMLLAFFARFGLFGILGLLGWPLLGLIRSWTKLNLTAQTVVIYLVVSGLMLDVLFFRHTITVLCALVLPLARKSSHEGTI